MVSLQSLKLEVPLEQICCSSSARPSFIIMNSPFATEQSIHIVSGGFRSQRPRRMLPIDPHECQSPVHNRGKLEVALEQICCSSSTQPSFIILNSPFATEQLIHIVSGGFMSQRPRRMLPIDPHESQSPVLNRGKLEVALEQICCSSSARQSFIIMHSPFATEQSIHIVSGGFMSQRPRRMLHIDLYLGTNKF